jgi:uncharacterized protein (TIGR02145 family)
MLDVKSTPKGFLPPRMTYAERNTIATPPAGLMIWCSNCSAAGELQVYNGTAWTNMVGGVVCGNPITDPRDGKSYTTVLIGTQCWFSKNLNIGTRITNSQTNNGIIEKFCYNDLESNCNLYGGLYQWDEAMQYTTTQGLQGICPTGWHLPTDAEWTTLTTYLGGTSVAGGKMKETGTVHWALPNTGATNSSGFTAFPGGFWAVTNIYSNLTTQSSLWSSTQNSGNAWTRDLSNSNGTVNRTSNTRTDARTVRCLKD